jgi:stage II sporulation protein D
MRRFGLLVALAVALVPATARADWRVDGHGWGHGVGLSQWGAYGYALREGRDFRWIVDHYFPGTTLGPAPSARIRVRLKRSSTMKICSATRVRDANRRSVRLDELRSYVFRRWRADGLRVVDATTRRSRARLVAPLRVSGGSSTCLRGRAENGRSNGTYRGAMVLLRDGGAVLAVNDVGLRQYLYGVVPVEVPASWPAEALNAQAVAARGYAVRSIKPGTPFDVLADTRSQVYGGADVETVATTAAVDQTHPLVALYDSAVAATYFSSSSGGRSAAVEEGFSGAAPVPYLVSVEDAHDDESPYHDWTVDFTDAALERKLGDWVTGDLTDVEVTSRSPSGRAATVRITSTEGERDVTGFEVRSRLGLRSTWFDFSRPRPGAAPPA